MVRFCRTLSQNTFFGKELAFRDEIKAERTMNKLDEAIYDSINGAKGRLKRELGHSDQPLLRLAASLCHAHSGSGSFIPSDQEDNHQADQRCEQLRLEYCVDDKNFQE